MGAILKANPLPDEITIDDNLSLRRFVEDDAESLFRIIQDDPDIKQSVSWPTQAHSPEDVRRIIKRLLQEDRAPYVLREKGVTVGFVGAWGVKDNENEIGFSYFLAKDKRGHGYITRAVQKLMEVTKQTLPINTFVVNITEANTPSQAVAAKLGFKPTDVLQKGDLPAPTRRYERAV